MPFCLFLVIFNPSFIPLLVLVVLSGTESNRGIIFNPGLVIIGFPGIGAWVKFSWVSSKNEAWCFSYISCIEPLRNTETSCSWVVQGSLDTSVSAGAKFTIPLLFSFYRTFSRHVFPRSMCKVSVFYVWWFELFLMCPSKQKHQEHLFSSFNFLPYGKS